MFAVLVFLSFFFLFKKKKRYIDFNLSGTNTTTTRANSKPRNYVVQTNQKVPARHPLHPT